MSSPKMFICRHFLGGETTFETLLTMIFHIQMGLAVIFTILYVTYRRITLYYRNLLKSLPTLTMLEYMRLKKRLPFERQVNPELAKTTITQDRTREGAGYSCDEESEEGTSAPSPTNQITPEDQSSTPVQDEAEDYGNNLKRTSGGASLDTTYSTWTDTSFIQNHML
ncbi:unnamed protein product [Bursaphelenchus okinawaensis]|uniref:Uncharacterized protein n=1 Tax=Bursaphelenchus okinawaensis TaxID=465554 RepID=A0A811L7P9_9BILA|nr:unnamed protein product [Bursaphelenchus okinawaensis]CAG9117560.1 unnamed protein product [Bursaphelenchus okinawaensis]